MRMTVLEDYIHVELQLLSRSENCSEGNTWIWDHVAQCLEETNHVVGFVLGCLAIALCAISSISLIIVHLRRSNKAHGTTLLSTFVLNLLSEVASLFGAVLSFQLLSQILYSLILTPIHILCLVVICNDMAVKRNKNNRNGNRKRGSKLNRCMYSCRFLLPLVFITLLVSIPWLPFSKQIKSIDVLPTRPYQTSVPEYWLLGYILGSLSGLFICSARVIDMLNMYRTVDSSRCLSAIYLTSILGGACYTQSVLSQSLSTVFIYHTLPWTIPKLVTIGLDLGILIQRILYKRHSRKRNLSTADAKSLLSSDDEVGSYFSDSGSEEIVWMPLQMMASEKPYYEIPVSRVQIISESDNNTIENDEEKSENDAHSGLSEIEDEKNNANSTLHNKDTEKEGNSSNSEEAPVRCCGDQHNINDIGNATLRKQQYSYEEKFSSVGSSSDSSEELDQTTGNSIIKQNIQHLKEVRKDERIASWINKTK